MIQQLYSFLANCFSKKKNSVVMKGRGLGRQGRTFVQDRDAVEPR